MPGGVRGGRRHAGERQREDEKERPERAPLPWWSHGPKDAEIQIEVLTGWAAAARQMGDIQMGDIINWLARRRDHIAAGRSSMRVGHVDFFARPIATR